MSKGVKEYKVIDERSAPNGRTVIDIQCPFCHNVFTAHVWSLAGSGKRCTKCGSLHGYRHGLAAPPPNTMPK